MAQGGFSHKMRRAPVDPRTLLLALATLGLAAAPARVVLSLEGLTPSGCSSPAAVKATIERTDGVTRADVSLERAEAIVEFDPTRVTLTELMTRVERVYLVKAIPRPGP